MDQIKKKYKSSKVVAGILLLIIAAVLFFISMADRFISVSSDAIDLNEALASDISVGEAYITVGYVYDYFSYYGNDNGTDVESKCYLIPVGEEEIMAIDLDGKNMKAIDRNLDKINAFFESGSDDYEGCHAPLIMAEVEFDLEEEANTFTPPEWFGEEVTNDRRYHNSNMI